MLRSPHLWVVAVVTLLLAVVYYADWFNIAESIPFGKAFLSNDYLHDVHRTLFLIPMLYAALVFQLRGAAVLSFLSLCIVLPRALFISTNPDALLRSLIFVALASLATVLLGLGQKRRNRLRKAYVELDAAHSELESSARQIQASEERYRDLFQSASEAIIVSDPDGNVIEANQATVALAGYSLGELGRMNIKQLFLDNRPGADSETEPSWMNGRVGSGRHLERLLRKDGTEAIVELTARPVTASGQVVAIETVARDVTEERRLRENMQFYIREITQAQEEERKRIARELHDETVQGLAALALDIEKMESCEQQLPAEMLEGLEELRGKTEALMEGVRRFSHELRPGVLDHLGLVPALEWLTEETRANCGINTSIEIIGKERRLSPEAELALFRIAQEALHNVRRHSAATKAVVRVEFAPKKVRLGVTDNGKGFELPRVLGDFAARKKLGILGMQERARLVGASFSVQSELGKGTNLVVDVAG